MKHLFLAFLGLLATCGQDLQTQPQIEVPESYGNITSYETVKAVTLSPNSGYFENISYTLENGSVTIQNIRPYNTSEDANRKSFVLIPEKRDELNTLVNTLNFYDLKEVYISPQYGSMTQTDGLAIEFTFRNGINSRSVLVDTLDPSAVPTQLLRLYEKAKQGTLYFSN